MLVVAKNQEVPLCFPAGADVGADITLEQIPSHVAAIEMVSVLKAIDRKDNSAAAVHDAGQVGPPFDRAGAPLVCMPSLQRLFSRK